MVSLNWVIIDSGNGWVPSGTEPLPKSMSTYDQWGSQQILKLSINNVFENCIAKISGLPPYLLGGQWVEVRQPWQQKCWCNLPVNMFSCININYYNQDISIIRKIWMNIINNNTKFDVLTYSFIYSYIHYYLFIHSFIYLSTIYLFIYLSICFLIYSLLFIYSSIYSFIFIYSFIYFWSAISNERWPEWNRKNKIS